MSNHKIYLIQSDYIFSTIYLGETFQSYLRIQNVGSQIVSNVSVKVRIVSSYFM